MGRLKQFLPLGKRPVLRHSIDSLRMAGVHEVVVVGGTDAGRYETALADDGARLVLNERPRSEMADSVRLGLQQIEMDARSAIILCLADHPLVLSETYGTLINRHHQAPGKIIIPTFQGRRGHPTLFPTMIIADIFQKRSLREIVRQDPTRLLLVEAADEGVVLDIDTEADYHKALALYQARRERPLIVEMLDQQPGESHV
ncbi:MAG: nucleotidyltransferase family protein [Deltaproteobacteria bacterium]